MAHNGNVDPVRLHSGYEYADEAYGKVARRHSAWSVLFFISLVVMIAALAGAGYIFYTYWSGQKVYDEYAEYANVDDLGEYATLGSFDVDWDALREINTDVVGWVYVPGTNINYPIVWREGDDKYYMTHNFGGNTANGFGAEYGCPVLASVCSPQWTDQISFVAGHHMLNGSMFSYLEEMADPAVFNDHRTFYLLTPEGNFRLASIACDRVNGKSKEVVIPNFDTEKEFRDYLRAAVDESLVQADPALPSVDTIKQAVAFYTCSQENDRYRIIVYCAVQEFLPAGSDVIKGNSLIDQDDVNDVSSEMGARVE